MDDPYPIPKLLRYLFGEAAETAHHAASPRLLLWCGAFDDWLEERGRKYRSGAYRLAERSWQRLLAQQGKLPWELAQADFEAHAAWMRAQGGYSSNYISHALGVLANFYRWCAARKVDPECSPGFNPAAGVRRPKTRPFEGASLLSRAEMEQLLGYMLRDSSPLGRREYAFTLARLHLGVALHSLQRLRWGQIHCASNGGDRKGEAWVRWRAEAEPVRLPEEAWEAIQQWLTASGRRADMREGDYIFTPLVDPLQREASDRGEAWARERYLSVDAIEDNLRLYGLRVGIDKRKLTPLALRRTALRLRLDSGDGPEQMRAFMDGQGRVRNTRRLMSLLPQLPPDPAPESQGAARPEAAELPLEAAFPQEPAIPAEPAHPVEAPLPLRKSIPYPPGYGMKHGLFAQSQPTEQVLEILAEDVQGVEAELTGLRLLSRGLMALQAQARSSRELSQLAQAYSLAAQRLATMITAEKQLEQGSQQGDWAENALAALDSIAEYFGDPPWSPDFRAEACSGDPYLAAGSRRLDEEIASMRLVLRTTLDLASEAKQQRQVGEYIHLVDVYSEACNRLMRLLRASQAGQGRLEAYLREFMDSALEEVTKTWSL